MGLARCFKGKKMQFNDFLQHRMNKTYTHQLFDIVPVEMRLCLMKTLCLKFDQEPPYDLILESLMTCHKKAVASSGDLSLKKSAKSGGHANSLKYIFEWNRPSQKQVPFGNKYVKFAAQPKSALPACHMDLKLAEIAEASNESGSVVGKVGFYNQSVSDLNMSKVSEGASLGSHSHLKSYEGSRDHKKVSLKGGLQRVRSEDFQNDPKILKKGHLSDLRLMRNMKENCSRSSSELESEDRENGSRSERLSHSSMRGRNDSLVSIEI